MINNAKVSYSQNPMVRDDVVICESEFPIAAGFGMESMCLAVITDVVGASYRPLGATMVITADGHHRGTLSSGCIEADVVLHAKEAIRTKTSKRLRYGRGSPFIDMQLPCGGGLEITLVPAPSQAVLNEVAARLAQRDPISIAIDTSGQLSIGHDDTGFNLRILPVVRLIVAGKGPEARTVYEMARATGLEAELWSPDEETLEGVPHGVMISYQRIPANAAFDFRTAVALFFHDHDWEPPILARALDSPAFFVGAQGSARARDSRNTELRRMGVPEDHIGRLEKPFGLIARARDPRTLAVGVLAQVLDRARLG